MGFIENIGVVTVENKYLYECVNRVPKISDKQIAKMRHIQPVLKDSETGMYRSIRGISDVDPRRESCLWNAVPTAGVFTFHQLNMATIITQHKSSVFFKPSLAEVYAWILVYFGKDWQRVTHFHIGQSERCGASSDIYSQTICMGGPKLIRGRQVSGGWELIEESKALELMLQ